MVNNVKKYSEKGEWTWTSTIVLRAITVVAFILEFSLILGWAVSSHRGHVLFVLIPWGISGFVGVCVIWHKHRKHSKPIQLSFAQAASPKLKLTRGMLALIDGGLAIALIACCIFQIVLLRNEGYYGRRSWLAAYSSVPYPISIGIHIFFFIREWKRIVKRESMSVCRRCGVEITGGRIGRATDNLQDDPESRPAATNADARHVSFDEARNCRDDQHNSDDSSDVLSSILDVGDSIPSRMSSRKSAGFDSGP